MHFVPVHQPVPCATLRQAPRSVSNPRPLRFFGVEGFDVYDISTPFVHLGVTYIAGRVEKRESRWLYARTSRFRA